MIVYKHVEKISCTNLVSFVERRERQTSRMCVKDIYRQQRGGY